MFAGRDELERVGTHFHRGYTTPLCRTDANGRDDDLIGDLTFAKRETQPRPRALCRALRDDESSSPREFYRAAGKRQGEQGRDAIQGYTEIETCVGERL